MRRSYWVYSIGLAVVWVILLTLRLAMAGSRSEAALYVFAGFVIGWIAETIARWVYPPPRRWADATQTPPSGARNYWLYSIGLAVAWAILLVVLALIGAFAPPILWLFAGFAIAWVSGTIARYVYPPPARWTATPRT